MEQLELFSGRSKARQRQKRQPQEWKLVSMRECPTPERQQLCDTPSLAADYWRSHVEGHPYFNPQCESFVVILLNTRRRILGHHLVGVGILDSVLVHPREVFRAAIVAAAHSVVLMHNHPGGDPSPSVPDIRATRDMIKAGQLLKIDVLDHVIMGHSKYVSLKELGQFYP